MPFALHPLYSKFCKRCPDDGQLTETCRQVKNKTQYIAVFDRKQELLMSFSLITQRDDL